jgi:hypothetical protein
MTDVALTHCSLLTLLYTLLCCCFTQVRPARTRGSCGETEAPMALVSLLARTHLGMLNQMNACCDAYVNATSKTAAFLYSVHAHIALL